MEATSGEAQDVALGLGFDRRLKLEFHGTKVTSDGGLLACRELDDALGLSETAGEVLTDTRTGANGRHSLIGQFRQSVFGRLGPGTKTSTTRIGSHTIRPCAGSWVAGP